MTSYFGHTLYRGGFFEKTVFYGGTALRVFYQLISDLFAGKLHALLYRSWKNRIKGRDWYDFEWYIRQGYSVHLAHFLERAHQSGYLLNDDVITIDQVRKLLLEHIISIDFEQAKQDVFPFIRKAETLNIWSQQYFSELACRLK